MAGMSIKKQTGRRLALGSGLVALYAIAFLTSTFLHVHGTVRASSAPCTDARIHWDAPRDVSAPNAHDCPACLWNSAAQSTAETATFIVSVALSSEMVVCRVTSVPRLAVFHSASPRAPPLA